MSKFKAGDTIRRIKNPVDFVPLGYVTSVLSTGEQGRKVWYRNGNGTEVYGSPHNWELVSSQPKQITTEKDKAMKYSFTVGSQKQIFVDRIQKDLSYKNPIALITEKSKDGDYYSVVFSKEFITVAEDKGFDILIGQWIYHTSKEIFSKAINLVRQVKKHPFPDGEREEVEVVIPNV